MSDTIDANTAALADLTEAVRVLTNTVAATTTEIDALLAQVASANAANDSVQIETLVDRIKAANASLNLALTSAVSPKVEGTPPVEAPATLDAPAPAAPAAPAADPAPVAPAAPADPAPAAPAAPSA